MERKRGLPAGVLILLLLASSALFATALAPYDPTRQNLGQDLLTSTRAHPLGTDKLGRDILSRTIYGSRFSLLVGVATVALSLSIGFALGALGGYFGGWVAQLLFEPGA